MEGRRAVSYQQPKPGDVIGTIDNNIVLRLKEFYNPIVRVKNCTTITFEGAKDVVEQMDVCLDLVGAGFKMPLPQQVLVLGYKKTFWSESADCLAYDPVDDVIQEFTLVW